MAALKVYGGLTIKNGKQRRTIVATTSQKEAARIVGIPLSYIRTYWSVSGNSVETALAMSEPGVAFYAKDTHGWKASDYSKESQP